MTGNHGTNFHRLFIALSIAPPTSTEIAALQDDHPQFRWSDEPNLHLTLRFIGEVDTPLKEVIATTLGSVCVEPFILPVENLGIFPVHGHPQVIVAGVGSGHPRLFQLQRRIEEALFSVGIPYEMRVFTPHITVARVSRATPQSVRNFLKCHREFSAAPFKVEDFRLYETHMTHFGSQYTPLNEYPLRYKQAKAI